MASLCHLTCKYQVAAQHVKVLLLLKGRIFQHVIGIKQCLLFLTFIFLETADLFWMKLSRVH